MSSCSNIPTLPSLSGLTEPRVQDLLIRLNATGSPQGSNSGVSEEVRVEKGDEGGFDGGASSLLGVCGEDGLFYSAFYGDAVWIRDYALKAALVEAPVASHRAQPQDPSCSFLPRRSIPFKTEFSVFSAAGFNSVLHCWRLIPWFHQIIVVFG